MRRDFAAAVELSRTAVESQPGNPYVNTYHAFILAANGQASQGMPYAERALQLDPLTERTPYLNILGFVSFHAAQYQRSLDAWHMNEERFGPNPHFFETYIVAANVALGRFDVARLHLQILDSYGEVDNVARARLLLSRFREPEEAEEYVLSRIRELRDVDAALADDGV
jgi:tetratricopeptide (TPR) repeat protein